MTYRWGSVAGQFLTLVGELAGEAGCQPGRLQGQRVSPMMGDTPCGVVGWRTRPSSVASLRGRATHARGLPSPYRAIRRSLLHLSTAVPESPKVGSRMVRAGGGGRRRLRRRCGGHVSAAFCGADHRRLGFGQGSTALQGAGPRNAPRLSLAVWRGSGGAVLRL